MTNMVGLSGYNCDLAALKLCSSTAVLTSQVSTTLYSRLTSRQITALESILRLLTIFELQTLVLFAITPPAGEFGAY